MPAKYSFHRTVIQPRDEDIPLFAKEPLIKSPNSRWFKKDTPPSVFIDWREDYNPRTYEDSFRMDKENWKLQKFIKDTKDL